MHCELRVGLVVLSARHEPFSHRDVHQVGWHGAQRSLLVGTTRNHFLTLAVKQSLQAATAKLNNDLRV